MMTAGASFTPPRTLPGARTRLRKRQRHHYVLAFFLVLPAMAFIGVFIAYPFVQGIYRSFFNYNGGNLNQFIGIQNYIDLFKDPLVGPSFLNVFILTSALVIQSVVVAFVAAWLIHHLSSERLKYLFRVLVMLPAVVPTIVGFLLWTEFLSPDGAVNQVLGGLGLGFLQGDWLGDPNRVIIGLIIVGFPWLNGINTLLFLAALGEIPNEIYDSARLDRAGRGRILWNIEIPAVMAQASVLMVLAIVIGLQSYENVYVMTGGGPFNSSNVPGLILFKNAFGYGRFGYASAIGVVLFIVIAAVLLLGSWLRKRARNAF